VIVSELVTGLHVHRNTSGNSCVGKSLVNHTPGLHIVVFNQRLLQVELVNYFSRKSADASD